MDHEMSIPLCGSEDPRPPEPIRITGEFGILIRRRALDERGISLARVFEAMYAPEALDINEDLISFGPCYIKEVAETFTSRLTQLGLRYFDDFCEITFMEPRWARFHAVSALPDKRRSPTGVLGVGTPIA